MAKSYSDKLKDPRWQKKRLEVLTRESFTCEMCVSTTKTLHVHHGYYTKGMEPWDYPAESLHCVCEDCHGEADATRKRLAALAGTLEVNFQEILCRCLEDMVSDKSTKRSSWNWRAYVIKEWKDIAFPFEAICEDPEQLEQQGASS